MKHVHLQIAEELLDKNYNKHPKYFLKFPLNKLCLGYLIVCTIHMKIKLNNLIAKTYIGEYIQRISIRCIELEPTGWKEIRVL